jgi:hypothetical protein
MKIRPVGAELFHVDGQENTTKLVLVFRNVAKAPKSAVKTFDVKIYKQNIQLQLKNGL